MGVNWLVVCLFGCLVACQPLLGYIWNFSFFSYQLKSLQFTTNNNTYIHVYIYVSVYIYMFIYIYIYREREREKHMYTLKQIYLYVHKHTHKHYIYIYIYIYIYMLAYIYVCVCGWVYFLCLRVHQLLRVIWYQSHPCRRTVEVLFNTN